MNYRFKAKLSGKIISKFEYLLKIDIDKDGIVCTGISPSDLINFKLTTEWVDWSKNLSGTYEIQPYDIFFEKEEDYVLYQLVWLND